MKDKPSVSSISYHSPLNARHKIFPADGYGGEFDVLNVDNVISFFLSYDDRPGNTLLFLAQLRYAVDEAIKYHLNR